jgi:hypothetical protein
MVLLSVSLHTARPARADLITQVTSSTTLITGQTATGGFLGTFSVQKFAVKNDQLYAVGTLSGTLTNLLTGLTTKIKSVQVAIPVSDISGNCDILHLELGPIDLDLLGLVVHLDKIVLDISAQQGPGNLLGNLLCAITGALDTATLSLTDLAKALNAVLALL